MRLMYQVRVHHAERLPRAGATLVAANHAGLIDGPLLLCLGPRPLSVLAKEELFRGPIGSVLRAGGAIKTDWRHADRSALGEARRALAAGGAVGIFPEGTRCRGTFEWLRGGITYLAAHSDAVVVPVAIVGSRLTGKSKSWIPKTRSPIDIVIGHPFRPDELPSAADLDSPRLRHASELLRRKLAAHVAASAVELGRELPQDDVSDPREDWP